MNTPNTITNATFKTLSFNKEVCGPDAFAWVDISTEELFNNKKVVVFALPGAFTPTCSSSHLPDYEARYQELIDLGVDDVICVSVNDAFVMDAWKKDQDIKNVTLLPDGSASFTEGMDMLVTKDNLGFGERSWRYSMFVDNGEIKKTFVEPGKRDNADDDPFEVSDVNTMIQYCKDIA
jgi:peroxiredoxin